jgi:hypothetical protein
VIPVIVFIVSVIASEIFFLQKSEKTPKIALKNLVWNSSGGDRPQPPMDPPLFNPARILEFMQLGSESVVTTHMRLNVRLAWGQIEHKDSVHKAEMRHR